jgi:hypothetical protein
MHLAPVVRGLKTDGHFHPTGKPDLAAEFDAVLVDDESIGGESKARLPRFDRDMLLQRTNATQFSRTHKSRL